MQAYVIHRGHRRKAKGFTPAEAFEAGLTDLNTWKKISWDPRRKTKYEENVKILKEAAKNK